MKIDLYGEQNHIIRGTNVILTCIVTGARPAAAVRWFNDSTAITEESYISTSAPAEMVCV